MGYSSYTAAIAALLKQAVDCAEAQVRREARRRDEENMVRGAPVI
jgi:hypothetical protein